jgi:hypothetical protein
MVPGVVAPGIVTPARAQPQDAPFAEIFGQLAGRLVGVVVNISTQAAPPPAAKTAPEAPPNSPGNTLDEVFRDFFGEKGAPGAPAPRIASLGSGGVRVDLATTTVSLLDGGGFGHWGIRIAAADAADISFGSSYALKAAPGAWIWHASH